MDDSARETLQQKGYAVQAPMQPQSALPIEVAKEKGNEAFQAGNYADAIAFYQRGAKAIMSRLCSGPDALGDKTLSDMDFKFNLNISICHIRMGDFESAIFYIDKALARRNMIPLPQLIKGLYRKADAQWNLKRLDQCLETLSDLLSVDPENKAALQLKQTVDRIWQKQCKNQDVMYRKLFQSYTAEAEHLEKEAAQRRKDVIELCGFSFEEDESILRSRRFDRKQWGVQLIDTVLYGLVEFSLREPDFAPIMKNSDECIIWFLGASSTFELRIIDLDQVLQQLPFVRNIAIVLIGFRDGVVLIKDGVYAEATDGNRTASLLCYTGLCEDVIRNYELEPPTIAVLAHPYFHKYFSTWNATIQWLVRRKAPTMVIGSSEPDYSEKEGDKILEGYGCNVQIKMTRNPFLISLEENEKISKLHHFFVFKGGQGLDPSNVTTTKINLVAADFHVL